MAPWLTSLTQLLWWNALAVAPVVAVVAVLCRVLPCRPSTRHTLWLMALLLFISPPLGAAVGYGADALRQVATLAAAVGFDRHPPPAAARDAVRLTAPAAPRGPAFAAADRDPEISASAASDDHAARGMDWGAVAPAVGDLAATIPPRVTRAWPGPGREPGAVARPPMTPPAPAAGASDDVVPVILRDLPVLLVGRVRQVRDFVLGVPSMPPGVWVCGSGAFLLWAGVRFSRVRLILRRGAAPSARTAELLAATAQAIGLPRLPRTVMVRAMVSPMIWCGYRPLLVLPQPLWSQLDDAGRQVVVLHELAHLRRRDHWVCWAELVIAALFWWHPLVWWIRRQLHQEAEVCCDAWVTWLMPRGRRVYAEALLKTKQYINRLENPVPAMGIGMTTFRSRQFGRRLTMIMTKQTIPGLSAWAVLLAGGLALANWAVTPAWACDPKKDRPEPVVAVPVPPLPNAPRAPRLPRAPWAPPAPSTPRAPSAPVVGGGDSTFETYLANRGGTGQPQDVHERLQRLERQMERLMAQLERIAVARPAGVPRAEGATAGGPSQTVERAYHLPLGKLKALSELMVRSDVPILVSRQKDCIVVHGTESDHAVFRAFVDLVDPATDRGPASPFSRVPPPAAPAFPGVSWNLDSAVPMDLKVQIAEIQAQMRRSLEQAGALERHSEELESRAEALEREVEHRQVQVERLAVGAGAQADGPRAELLKHAQLLAEQAAAQEREAQALAGRAEDLDNEAERHQELADQLETVIERLHDGDR